MKIDFIKPFETMVTGTYDSIMDSRGQLAKEEVLSAQDDYVKSLEADARNLRLKIIKHTDLNPKSKDSLQALNDNFDAKEWTRILNEDRLKLELLLIKVEQARDTYNSLAGVKKKKKKNKNKEVKTEE